MAEVVKIDSNVTGLRYAQEDSLGVVSGDETWTPLEPNSYADFGGAITTIARNPINPSRQRKKGVTSDLDASGGFNMDLTQTNLVDVLQGFLFATKRNYIANGSAITSIDTTDDSFNAASGLGTIRVGSLIFASGFTNAANNGLHTVLTVSATKVTVSTNLTTEASPPAAGKLVVVGHSSAAGDLDVDAAGTWPALTSTTLNFTTLGLVVGQWIHVGGDVAPGSIFSNAVNNGWKRIRSIAANRIEFDKVASITAMVTESNTTRAVQLFFGTVIKNESDPALVVRRTYHLERTLGAPDDALPSQIQAEYIRGAVPGEFKINIPTANKVTVDLSFQGRDTLFRTGAQGVLAGSRPAIVEASAFNTSSDISRIKLAEVINGNPLPPSNFTYVSECNLSINNSLNPQKAVGFLGSFDIAAGTFVVSGNIEAYFATVAAADSVRNNKDITLDIIMVKENAGIVIDVPLITLGNARANVTQDQAIKLPLQTDAGTGAKVNPSMDHTILFEFFDYLPTAADI